MGSCNFLTFFLIYSKLLESNHVITSIKKNSYLHIDKKFTVGNYLSVCFIGVQLA